MRCNRWLATSKCTEVTGEGKRVEMIKIISWVQLTSLSRHFALAYTCTSLFPMHLSPIEFLGTDGRMAFAAKPSRLSLMHEICQYSRSFIGTLVTEYFYTSQPVKCL